MKLLLQYLRGTERLGLAFQRLETRKPKVLQGYVDADYAGDFNQRRSTTNYVFTVAECIVNWKAKLQDIVTLFNNRGEVRECS